MAASIPLSGAWAQTAESADSAVPSLRRDPRVTGGLRGTADAAGQQQTPDDPAGVAPADAAAPTGSPGESGPVINYGRPTPKKPKLFTPKSPLLAPNPRSLPPLMRYPTAPGTKKRNSNPPQNSVTPADAASTAAAAAAAGTATPQDTPGPTVAVVPWNKPPLRPKLDDKPFDPLGIDAGSLRLFPFVETSVGYDSNPNRQSSEVKGSSYARANGGLDVNSQWDNHSLTATLRGGYSDYFNFHEADRPDAQAKANGRIDVLRDTQIDSEARFTLDTQQPGSQQLAIPGSSFIVGRPLIMTYGTTLGVTQRFGRLSLRLRGTFDRFDYQDATLSNGSTLLLSENDYNDIGINGRASYELTPGFIPYVDVTGDQRDYDSLFDSSGFERSSTGITGKLGSTFEVSRMLTGDLAAGYEDRHYADPRLPNAKGPTLDGSIIWTPSDLTKVTLSTGTDFVETTLVDASAAISRRVSLQVAHSFFRDFTVTGIATYQINNYVGQPVTEQMYTGTLRADYNITRDIMLRASYNYQRYITTFIDSNNTANVFLLGIRLQR